jgi:hypothetical protein
MVEVHRYPQDDTCRVKYIALSYEGDVQAESILGEVAVPMPRVVDDAFRQPHYQWLREHAGMLAEGQCVTRTAATLVRKPRSRRRWWLRLAGRMST